MKRTLLVLALAALLSSLPLGAQRNPNVARGTGANTTVGAFDLDKVNLFNGNLEIQIPLGLEYPVGSSLSYRLSLTYNSNVWEQQLFELPSGGTRVQSLPWGLANAGLGWMLSLGRFNPPTASNLDTPRNTYMSPDGALHSFYPTLHEGEAASAGVEYTRDGSYLRYKAASREIEFPDGLIRRFDAQGRPVQIRDRFNNQVNVSYAVANQWQISDTHGRVQRVFFRTDLPNMPQAVDRIELTTFQGAAPAVYAFRYSKDDGATFVVTGCGNTDPLTANIAVPLLTRITLPDGSTYALPVSSYATQTAPPCQAGMLRGLGLPTLGRIEWDYQSYSFPSESSQHAFRRSSTGVAKRRLKDVVGTVLGEWTYGTSLTPAVPGGAVEEMVNTVIDPLGHKTERFFSVFARTNQVTEARYEYGLPISRKQAGDGAGRLLSARFYEGTSTLLRSVYLRYEHDRVPAGAPSLDDRGRLNQRVASRRVVREDDVIVPSPVTKAYTDFTYSQFDGLGHYRRVTLGSNFNATSGAESDTNWNPANGLYTIDPATNLPAAGHTFAPPAPASPWVLETFTEVTTTENGATAKTELCFNPGNGALERRRQLRSGTSRTTSDVIALFTASAEGNLVTERYYGGDGANLSTTGSLCGLGFGTPQYRIEHTYEWGGLKTSQYGQGATGLVSFKSASRSIDRWTGLVKSSQDASGLLTTTYEYDTMGRLTYAKPAQEAWTRISYPTATSQFSLARVNVERVTQGGATLLARRRTLLDSLGRLWRQETLQPDGANWSTVETLYNAAGYRQSVSEPGALTFTTRYLNYDPFGRPRTVRPPDGASHEVTLTYVGDRWVTRSKKVATSYSTTTGTATETSSSTTETFDGQGRLVQVGEPGGVVTRYEYNLADRLKRVCQGASGSTCAQERLFTYDNRGFLLSEKHPEKGGSGNGTVTYPSYDSRGHARRIVDGGHDLTYTFDAAERLVSVRETGGAQRPLKAFQYGDTAGNGASDYRNGSLVRAERWNYHLLGTTPYTTVVAEDFIHGGREGRISQRNTAVTLSNGTVTSTNETFSVAFAYDELGLLGDLTYPSCTFPACQPASTPRTVSHVRSQGFLTALPGYTGTVPGQAAGIGVTYHLNGMLSAIAHANGVVDNQSIAANGLARPSSLSATRGTTTLWSTGSYSYDGAGNPWKIGTSWFEYDPLTRVKTSAVFPDALGGGTQQKRSYSYDSFGNLTTIVRQAGTGAPDTVLTPTSPTTNRLTGGAYDASGNLIAWSGATYEYDAFDLISHWVSGSEEWFYIYNADNERLWSFKPTVGATPRHDLWALRDLDGKVLRQWSNPGYTFTSYEDYVYLGDQLFAGYLPSEQRHFHLDHLGSVRLVTNAAGGVSQYHVFHPFGEEATPFVSTAERMQFTGHERDLAAVGGANPTADDLDYMHARHYSPLLGRFLSTDPVQGGPRNPQSWNLYTYVRNNPMRLVDPTGLESIFRCSGCAASVTVTASRPNDSFDAGMLGFLFWASAMNGGLGGGDLPFGPNPPVSRDALSWLRGSEGFRSNLYDDQGGHCTIGYGHLVHKGPCNDADRAQYAGGITQEEAQKLLEEDVNRVVTPGLSKVNVALSQEQVDALASLIFNIGSGGFSQSNVLKNINQGHYLSAGAYWTQWNKTGGKVSRGLQARRAQELTVFFGD